MSDPKQAATLSGMEAMDGALDTVDCYRAKIRARGYSQAAVERMTVDFHKAYLDWVTLDHERRR